MKQNRFLSILVLMFLCFGIGMFAQLWAVVPNAVSNPYPADGEIDVPSTLRLTWDHVKGAGGAPTGYRVSLREAPLNPNGFTFKFEMYGIRYYLSNAPATWEVARQESWSYGGYLASSFSAQMNTLFQTHAPEGQNVFIGLSDHIEEGVYKWQDGRTFGYANWDSNEPNNGGGSNEDAVELRKSNGKWNDISVTVSRYYFMQIPGKVINNEITATAYYDFNHVVSFNRVFYWDVTPFNADGDGPTSSFSFRVRNSGTIPAATTVVGPTGGSNVLNPTLSWNNSASATMRYLIEYPGTIQDGKVVTGTSYSLKDANLEPNSSYCWIAIPYSTSGRPWVTGWWSFSTGNGGAAPGTISTISSVIKTPRKWGFFTIFHWYQKLLSLLNQCHLIK